MNLLIRNRPVLNSIRLLSRSRVYNGRAKTHFTTDDIQKGVPVVKVIAGLSASALLLVGALYYGEHSEQRKNTFFSERYPDPRIKVFHQEIAIPELMIQLTRENYCKDEWVEFESCLGSKMDIRQIGSGVKEILNGMKELQIDKKCHPMRDSLHLCQEKAMFDEELYFAAKEKFLAQQDKLLVSGMPKVQTDQLEELVQKEVPIYTTFDETGKSWVIGIVKKHKKEHFYLDKEGNWIDFEAGLLAESKANDEERVRQTYNRRRRALERKVKELEAELENQKKDQQPIEHPEKS